MKTLIQVVNASVQRLLKAETSREALRSDVEKLELEIKKKQSKLSDLKQDLVFLERLTNEKRNEYETYLTSLRVKFSEQERFKNSSSEEINCAFNEEVAPDLDEIE